MAVFVTSTSAATLHGVYAIERQPPTTIRASGTATVGLVEQFPWGPDSVVTTVSDFKTFMDTFAPAGASHTGPGYMAVMGKSFPRLKIFRVLGSTAAAASATINKTGPTAFIVVALKYKGTLGNSVVCTTSAATDGDSDHFNLTVTLTGASGTTVDKFENLNYSGTGTDSTPDCTNCLLVDSITKSSAGTPIIGSTTCSGGVDGTIDSAAYVGTAGAGDNGIAKFEGETDIDFIMTADPGNSLRAAVNAGLVAHADLMTDRIALINNDSGKTGAQVRTDVASYRSLRAAYIDVWANVRDDVDGTIRLVPPAPFFASVAASLSPSTSPAWKNTVVKTLLRNIVSLETSRGADAYNNTLAGICTLKSEALGGYTFEAAVNTNAPITPSKKSLKRTRMGHYIAKAVTESLRENTDAPNVPSIQQDEVNAVANFLDGLKRNATVDPINQPHILDYALRDLQSFNTPSSLAAGEFTIPADVQISPDQEKIFLSLQYGETVTISATL